MTPHEELLAEIDAVIQGTVYWRGGRLDTIKHLLDRVEKTEAFAAVRGGEWCAENRREGRGPCGACAWCCQQVRFLNERLRTLLNRCAPRVGSVDDPEYDLACEVNEVLNSTPTERANDLLFRVDVFCSGGWQHVASFAGATDAYEYGENYSINGARVWKEDECIAITYGPRSWHAPQHLRNCDGHPCECGEVPRIGSMVRPTLGPSLAAAFMAHRLGRVGALAARASGEDEETDH